MRTDRLQLPLPFAHRPRFTANDFIAAASNQQALRWLDPSLSATTWPDRRLALFGQDGCGKSHLLHVWAERTGAPLFAGQTLNSLDAIPQNGGLALDDADTVADETLLFHLLNTARDRGLSVLISARTPPSRWPVRLPDLASRLRAITAVEIGPPDDDLLARLLGRLLAERQLSATPAVQHWLLLRLPRSAGALREAVAALDRMSLAWRTPISRDLAAHMLAETGLLTDDPDEVRTPDDAPSSPTPRFL